MGVAYHNPSSLSRGQHVYVAHFAPAPDFGFAIEMNPRMGRGPICRPSIALVTQNIVHDHVGMPFRIAQPPAANSTNVLLKLRDHTGILGQWPEL